MSDQWASAPAGHGYAGDAKRERPLHHAEGVGPWNATIMVTPVLHISPGTMFELAVQWTGPPLSVPPHAHDAFAPSPTWQGGPVLANDSYYSADRDLVIAMAGVVEAALREPRRVDLRALAKLFSRAE